MSVALADERTVISRILEHIDRGETDLARDVWREPVAHYTDPARFAAELRLFRRTPTPFCPSIALREPGAYLARDAAMVPILAVRGQDGVVRAFRNACRHRGAQVVQGAGCQTTFACPYHGWTYGLDGRLRGVPHEHGFPGLDKATHGLVPVTAVERGGIVWVTQDDPGVVDPQLDLVPDLFGPEWRLIGAGVSEDMPVNWKIVVEGVLEGYHIRATHAETFYPRQYDNLNVIETFGRNARVTYPYRNIERLRGASEAEQRTAGVLTHVYHLFPNVAVSTFPTHRNLSIFEPVGIDRTRTTSFVFTDRPAEDTQDVAVKKGRDFVTEGTAEDRAVQIAVQQGLAAGANTHITFGLFEGAITHMHKTLASMLD